LEVLQLFVCSEYEYVEFQEVSKNSPAKAVKNHHFDKTKCLDLLSEYLPSTALHLAIESEQYHCAKLLIEYGASSQIVNYRNLCPFELSFNERLIKFY
jgi:ankyrin repeat protein